jgi:hypothetical protein
MSLATPDAIVVLDDGQFFVELNAQIRADIDAFDATNVPGVPCAQGGFLLRRCYVSVTSPGGYECIGSFACCDDGRWEASVDAAFDPATGTDSRRVARGASRLDAIAAVWAARHEARCRHLA